MSYYIEQLPDQPIILVAFEPSFGGQEAMRAYINELTEIYNNLPEAVYQIFDTTNLKLDFNNLMEFVRISIKEDNTVVRHPHNKGVIVITNNRFYQLAAKGLNTMPFGNINLQVMESMTAALNWIQDQVAQ